jgi:hypothetical protein
MWPRPRGLRRECRGVHDHSGRHRAGPGLAGRRWLPQFGGHAAIIVTSSTPLWYITRATGVVAVLHGLGTGSDTRTRWVLVVTLLCVAAIACLERPARTV